MYKCVLQYKVLFTMMLQVLVLSYQSISISHRWWFCGISKPSIWQRQMSLSHGDSMSAIGNSDTVFLCFTSSIWITLLDLATVQQRIGDKQATGCCLNQFVPCSMTPIIGWGKGPSPVECLLSHYLNDGWFIVNWTIGNKPIEIWITMQYTKSR